VPYRQEGNGSMVCQNVRTSMSLIHRPVFLMLGALVCMMGVGRAGWAGEVYTKFNIHVQDKVDKAGNHQYNASCANWTDPGAGHIFIPVNTAIEIVKADPKEITFKVKSDDRLVHLGYNIKWMMGMDVNKYVELITSTTPVSLDALSEADRKGIKDGIASVGMTKAGVMAALGYPAAHRTPSPETATVWVYWTNRFKSIAVEFDDQGQVKTITR